MHTQVNKTWTVEQLVNLSNALGSGYGSGVQAHKASHGDRWTAQRHIQASNLRGQAYL